MGGGGAVGGREGERGNGAMQKRKAGRRPQHAFEAGGVIERERETERGRKETSVERERVSNASQFWQQWS